MFWESKSGAEAECEVRIKISTINKKHEPARSRAAHPESILAG